ncbi:MAG: DNA repair protein RadA, partial [Bifidobacterium castoris]|nr:DNA repair protein RadA [Bifidobacterium castoris]
LASAATSTPIARSTCAVGEISLTGQVRPVPRLEYRLREAARLGFTTALVPPMRTPPSVPGLRIVEVCSLRDALDSLKLTKRGK